MPTKRMRRSPGEGSIFESPAGSGHWVARVIIEGKPIRRRANSKKNARAKLDELKALAVQRLEMQGGGQTLELWLNSVHTEWKTLIQPKQRTIDTRADLLSRYILPHLGDYKLVELHPLHIQQFIDTLYKEIRAAGFDGARTVIACAALLKQSLTLAFERRLIPISPYSGIRLPKYRRKPIHALSDEECRFFLAAIAGKRDLRTSYTTTDQKVKRMPTFSTRFQALWWCYLLLGLRRGEGLGIRADAFDPERMVLVIDQQVQRAGGKKVLATPKTESSVRTLPVTARLGVLLDRRIAALEVERQQEGWQENGLLFPNVDGDLMWPDSLDRVFRVLREVAGLPPTFTMHHMRHTCATLLDEHGATQRQKEGILGHASETMEGRYTEARIAAMRRVLQIVEDYLFDDNLIALLDG